MKKILTSFVVLCIAVSIQVQADTTTKHTKTKKAVVTPTPQVTVESTPAVTAKTSPTPSAVVMKPTATPTAVPAPSLFSSNTMLYDRVGASGDLRQAVALASTTLGSSLSKHDRSVFLWLGKAVNGENRQAAYIRLALNGIELGGARNPWLVLTGMVYDQSGSDCKSGDAIEVAVDFRDVKVDYEGTKLGEVQKGNDISDQFFELLNGQDNYQWVVLAQEQLRDEKNPSAVPAFLVNAKEGYAFLESLSSARGSNTNMTVR